MLGEESVAKSVRFNQIVKSNNVPLNKATVFETLYDDSYLSEIFKSEYFRLIIVTTLSRLFGEQNRNNLPSLRTQI